MRKPLKLKYKFTWSPELNPKTMSEDTALDIFKTLMGFGNKSDEDFLVAFFQKAKELRENRTTSRI